MPGQVFHPEMTVFPTDSTMRVLARSCRAIYSGALMRACWPAPRLWRPSTSSRTPRATTTTPSSRTPPTTP